MFSYNLANFLALLSIQLALLYRGGIINYFDYVYGKKTITINTKLSYRTLISHLTAKNNRNV